MSYSDDTNSDQGWKKHKGKKPIKLEKSPSKPKYSQKFLDKWLKIFDPWLTRCKDDPNKPFCKACQTRLDCNRCHLQRHEKTSKHVRNLEFLIYKGEGAAQENLSIRRERSKYYQQRKVLQEEMDMDTVEGYTEDDLNADNLQTEQVDVDEIQSDEHAIKEEYIYSEKPNRSRKLYADDQRSLPSKKERISLLMQIQKDKNDLMDSFRELMGSNVNTTPSSSKKEKNHIDLFFESVSSSVKALTPKLIAEAKMRVSQLIGELELRALTELEQQQQVGAQNHQSYVVN